MSSIDRVSLEQFIAHPENYHLEKAGDLITAHLGRSEVDETVHQTALDALNALSKKQGISPSGIASFLSSVIPLSISSDASLITQCQQAEFNYKIDKWAQKPGKEPTENRAVAAIWIKNAYTTKNTSLDLHGFSLTSLPPEIGQLVQLQELCLNHNRLASLPAEIGQLINLKKLSLVNNNLSLLPATIGQLFQLNVLNLAINKLTDLPAQIGDLTGLTFLALSNNCLTTLPDTIGQLVQLKELWLYNNKLSTLSPKIGQLTQLTFLGLSYNLLTALPNEIAELLNLKELNLTDTPLTNKKTAVEIIVSYPFLLKLDSMFGINNVSPETLQQVCQRNGLALQFIPHDKQTKELVLMARTQNPASRAFARADLIT